MELNRSQETQICVIDEKYISEERVTLRFRFKVFSLRGDAKVYDAHDRVIFRIRDQVLYSMNSITGDCDIPIAYVRMKLFSTSVRVFDQSSHSEIGRFKRKIVSWRLCINFINKIKDQSTAIQMKPKFFGIDALVYPGREVIAEIVYSFSMPFGYLVTVAPGIDQSFIIMLCYAYGYLSSE